MTTSATIAPSLHQWTNYLDGERLPDTDTLTSLANAMNTDLNMRDAIIVTCLMPRDQWDEPFLHRMIDHPRATAGTLQHLLNTMRTRRPDPVQTGRAQAGLDAMIDATPASLHVQPLAVGAYLYWWIGDPRATDTVLQTLDLDPECNLANIINRAIKLNIYPSCQAA